MNASSYGVILGIPPLIFRNSNPGPLSGPGTVSDGQFDWGGRHPKSSGGAQRFPQNGWKSFIERNGIRELYCETYKSSSCESRT